MKTKSHSFRGQEGASVQFMRIDIEVPETKIIFCIQNLSKQSINAPLL